MATKTTPLVSEAVQAYLDSRYDLSPASIKLYRNTLNRLVKWVPVKQMVRLTADDLEGFLLALRKGDPRTGSRRGMGDTSIVHVIATLKGFVDYGHRKGWCRGDLLSDLRKPSKSPRRDFLQLTANELLLALELTDDPRDRICIASAMNTGLRSVEMKAIRLGHVDLDNLFIFITVTKNNTTDQMPINLDYEAEMHRWLDSYRAECGALAPSWHLMPGRARPLMLGPGRITRGGLNPLRPFHDPAAIAHKALSLLGYSKESIAYEGMHTFRRSVARIYFDQATESGGYDGALRETAALLHHKSTATTELYLGMTNDTERRNVRLKGKPFLSALGSSSQDIRKIG